MSGTPNPRRAARFGVYDLDLELGELRKNGLRVKVQEQPRRVLVMLVERAGEVVSREQIKRALWPEDTFVDFDHSLNTAVNKLREILNDSASNSRYVETVPRQGYRFIAPVEFLAPVEPLSPENKRRLPARWIAAGAVSLAIALSVFGTWVGANRTTPDVELESVPLTTLPGVEMEPSFSPDASQVAFVWATDFDRNGDIYIKTAGSEARFRLTSDPRDESMPVWSPNGRWIAFMRRSDEGVEYLLVPPTGGPERSAGKSFYTPRTFPFNSPRIFPPDMSWLPDSRHLVVGGVPGTGKAAELEIIDVETLEKRALTQTSETIVGDHSPAVSPDGRTVAFIRSVRYGLSDIYVLDLDDALKPKGPPRKVPVEAGSKTSVAWTADGSEIVYTAAGELRRVSAKGGRSQRLALSGSPRLTAKISRDGKSLVYVSGNWGQYGIWQLRLGREGNAAGPLTQFIHSTRGDQWPRFSPDGTRVAFDSGRSGGHEIWVCNADGGNPVQLTSYGLEGTGNPEWSPDGRSIAFYSSVDGNRDVFVVSAGGGPARQVTRHPATDVPKGWSPDGQWIYSFSDRDGTAATWAVPANGGTAERVGNGLGGPSADGRWMYFLRGSQVWRRPARDGTEEVVIDAVHAEAWTAGPKGLYWITPRGQDGLSRIQFRDEATGATRTLATTNLSTMFGMTVSPDGRTLLFTQRQPAEFDLMLVRNFR